MSVEEARKHRTKATAIFTEFCLARDEYKTKLFCFFEGEDYKYYQSRLEEFTGYDYSEIIYYNCNGKNEVLKVHDLIKQQQRYRSVKKAFFIDKDYVVMRDLTSDMYQTPCSSIENLYTSVETFCRVINREFGISANEADFLKLRKDYTNRQKEFHSGMKYFNGWLCYHRHKEDGISNRINLKKIKIWKFIKKISIDQVLEEERIDFEKCYSMFPKVEREGDGEELNECLSHLEKANLHQHSRGKFELTFFKEILEDLKSKNSAGEYFSKKRTSVNLNTSENILSTLSLCADTPNCLKEFLLQYKRTANIN